jgi:hypothetical protein
VYSLKIFHLKIDSLKELNQIHVRLYTLEILYHEKSISINCLAFVCHSSGCSTIVQRKIQLVILFDTSNSMDGLIDQAKSRIWAIVNETSGLKYQGITPVLEIAMYDYGNSGLSAESHYIRQQIPFTSDLDLVSEKLFSLRTNGGSEYCGAVIQKSLMDLNWSLDPKDLKMIYIAGNEPFNQGPIDYKKSCELAVSKNVFVNTIHCGSYEEGVRGFWKDGADVGEGKYFHIDYSIK